MLGFTRSAFILPLFSLAFIQQTFTNAQSQAQGRPRVYACPRDNGVRYTTPAPNTITYELKCNQGTTQPHLVDTPRNSQKGCADACSENPRCQSSDWNSGSKNCALFGDYIPTISMASVLRDRANELKELIIIKEGVDTWFPIERRPPPERTYACPADDGAQYTTPEPNAITYQLQCNKGTTASWLDGGIAVPSQKACADLCSQEPQCQSCDWRVSDGRCVRFGTYIPTIPSPGINTWFPLEERGQPRPEVEPRTPPACPASKTAVIETTNFVPAGSEAQCPDNDGKSFVTPSGAYFKIKCNALNPATTNVGGRATHDLADCMKACGDIPECKSVTFSGGKPSWDCKFFGTGVEASVADPTNKKSFAYILDPPISPKPDDEVLLCATECPAADGQTYDTPNGQKFHMDCCKRHGTTIIDSDVLPSLIACMTACSVILGCQSVDFHQDSGMCYFGKHSGEPTIAVAGWSSAHSLGCAGACKKGDCGCGAKSEL